MAVRPPYLADKSALARIGDLAVAERLRPLFEKRRIATCTIVDLEMLFSARSPAEYSEARAERRDFPLTPIDQLALDRALEVQSLLAERSRHRGASIPDLIIAAAAEAAELTVLHYDADFDLIAEVTGQPVEWVVEPGSIP